MPPRMILHTTPRLALSAGLPQEDRQTRPTHCILPDRILEVRARVLNSADWLDFMVMLYVDGWCEYIMRWGQETSQMSD